MLIVLLNPSTSTKKRVTAKSSFLNKINDKIIHSGYLGWLQVTKKTGTGSELVCQTSTFCTPKNPPSNVRRPHSLHLFKREKASLFARSKVITQENLNKSHCQFLHKPPMLSIFCWGQSLCDSFFGNFTLFEDNLVRLPGCLVTAQDRFSQFIQSLSLLFPPWMQV